MESRPDDSIQVCIRIKPGLEEQSLLQFTQNEIHLEKNHFGFDKIFPPDASQEEIFQSVGTKVITHTLDGYNGCIFVYGQTGSGKTYTMMGEDNGLMQRSFVQLFRDIEKLPKSQCTIYCSYYEIYNEQIIDLLDARKDKRLSIRQDMKKGVFIQNLLEETVYSEIKLLQCLNTGMRNRHVGQTVMNRESSRSHSIFTISFLIKSEVNGMQVLKTPKLHFVDLAGSQRQKMTAASGDRLKQAGNINKSLTTLGMVINALASQRVRAHIPYRDSKLTSLLRDSLGGNSKTYLIATISRNILCFQETLSTLNFANRAKMVKVKALVNEQSLSTNIQTYKEEIKRLKAEILRLKSQKRSPAPSQIKWMNKASEESINFDNQFKQINDKISVISEHLSKNSISPSLQSLLEQIKNLKPTIYLNPSRCQNSGNMVEESQDRQDQSYGEQADQDEEDPLIQYLRCNNSLLEKMYTKIDQYLELKQQLRNVAYNNQLTIAKFKTPSKFERDQYQATICDRDIQINSLHEQLRQLRNVIAEQEIKIQEAVNDAKDKTHTSEQNTEKYEKERTQLQRELNTLKNLMKQTNEEVNIMSKRYQEIQLQCKQNKELYLFAEQNYEMQKLLRDNIEKNLTNKTNELKNLKNEYSQKLSEQKDYYEEVEEGLRQEISILTQTVEFNEHLIAEYKGKLQGQKLRGKELERNINELQRNKESNLKEKETALQNLYETREALNQIQKQYSEAKTIHQKEMQKFLAQIQNWNIEYNKLKTQSVESKIRYEEIIEQKEKLFIKLEENLKQEIQSKMEMIQKYEERKQQIQLKHQAIVRQYEMKLVAVNKHLEEKAVQYELNISKLTQQLLSVNQSLSQRSQELKQHEAANIKLKQEYTTKLNEIKEETKLKLEKVRNIQLENEELKKHYKHLQKENYKMKAKYSENNNKTQEELALKVDYYEEKFKLMSIEYQKALEVVKKLKEKELTQAQKIIALEESHKVLKMSVQNQYMNQDGENALKNLSQENIQLRKELDTLKTHKINQQLAQSYLNKTTLEQQKIIFKQKQEYFKSKIQQSINRWDPSKQNFNKNRTLEELIQCWENLEAQSRRKLDAIAKGIKKEQKLKTQNKLILKENIYLREQITSMEKNMGNPRKIVKTELSHNKIYEDNEL